MKPHLLLTALLLASLCGCKSPDRYLPDGNAAIIRFDTLLNRYPMLDSAAKEQFRKDFDGVLRILPGLTEHNDSALEAYVTKNGQIEFSKAIARHFTAGDSINNILMYIAGALNEEFPDIRQRRIYGIISTYNQSVFLSDSVILTGLNHYLGENFDGYDYFDRYRRKEKTPQRLPYDIAEAVLNTDYPIEMTNGMTTLNYMLYEGAILYIISRIMPQCDEKILLGYDEDELAWLERNEKKVWNTLIEKKYIYSVDALVYTRLFRPSPHSFIISQEAPGRAGRYIGYKIVESYMDSHPDMKLSDLIDSKFYMNPRTLSESDYFPK